MKRYDAIAAGVSHIFQNRLRAGLSILGICIGIASVLCMIAIGEGAKKIITDDIEKLGGSNQVQFWTRTSIWKNRRLVRRTTERFTLEDVNRIEAECPDVLFALPKSNRRRGTITSRGGGRVYFHVEGVTTAYTQGLRWEVQAGRFFAENEIDTAAQVCVLGADAAEELFGNSIALGQEVKIKLHWLQPPIRCRVIGIMTPKGRSLRSYYSLDETVFLPLTTHLQRLSGDHYIYGFTVFFKKDANVYRVVDSVKDVLRKRHRGKEAFIGYWIPKGTFRRLERIQKVTQLALGCIAGVSLFVSGIGIMNICLVSVGERIREIGVRKSMGARQIDIFYQFLTESICLCLCGGILGIVFSWFAAHALAQLAVHIIPIVPEWPVVLSLPWISISVVFSAFMGVSFGLYPALQASKLSPIEALRTAE